MIVKFECMPERMAAKWFFLHERQRHVNDIVEIDKDLKKLEDIELPPEFLAILNERFEV